MEVILYGLFFITGYLMHSTIVYVLSLGVSVTIYKRAVEDCLLLFADNYEKQIHMNEALYLSFEKGGAPEEIIKDLKKRDKIKLNEHMNSVILNMLRIIPDRFRNLVDFNNWKTAEIQITKIIKSRKELDN
jgi:hypothetical protein